MRFGFLCLLRGAYNSCNLTVITLQVLSNPVSKRQYDLFGAAGVAAGTSDRRVSIGLPAALGGAGAWVLLAVYGAILLGVAFALLLFFRGKENPASDYDAKKIR
jgi:hypothetical protein